jgi:hypothetical protein
MTMTVASRANEEIGAERQMFGEDHQQIEDVAAARDMAGLKKHPLRIDIRDNNPEQEAAERLLESTEYGARAAQTGVFSFLVGLL